MYIKTERGRSDWENKKEMKEVMQKVDLLVERGLSLSIDFKTKKVK